MIQIDKETVMKILDILADLSYRDVEAVFKTVAIAVIKHEEQGAVEVPDPKIIVPGSVPGADNG